MYMFIRTWCWPGTISAGPPGPSAIRAWSSAAIDVGLVERPGLVDRRLPELERPVRPGARAPGGEHRAPGEPPVVPVEQLDAERVVDRPVVVEAAVEPLDLLGRHEVQEVLVEVRADDRPTPLREPGVVQLARGTA